MTDDNEKWGTLDEKIRQKYIDFVRHLVENGYIEQPQNEIDLAKTIYKANEGDDNV